MQVQASHDFPRPRARVQDRMRDPARVEAVLRDLGATLERLPGPGPARWQGHVEWRGAARPFVAELTEAEGGGSVILTVRADVAEAETVFRLTDAPGGGCRVVAEARVTPTTTMARLALASLSMLKRKLVNRLSRLIQALGRP